MGDRHHSLHSLCAVLEIATGRNSRDHTWVAEKREDKT